MDLVPAIVFAFVCSVTPGPNNVMVAASAANHGVGATLPHVLGITVGFAVMALIVGLGLAEPLADHPQAQLVLRWVGAAWMLVLAWKIARAAAPHVAAAEGRRPPLGFIGAALFQWINPKAWLIVLAAITAFISGAHPGRQALILAIVFGVVCLPCVLAWAMLGAGAGRVLASPTLLRAFNITMALLLVASVIPVLWPGLE